MITVLTDTEAERLDVLTALRNTLPGGQPFQVLVQGRITDWYPSGWISGPVLSPYMAAAVLPDAACTPQSPPPRTRTGESP